MSMEDTDFESFEVESPELVDDLPAPTHPGIESAPTWLDPVSYETRAQPSDPAVPGAESPSDDEETTGPPDAGNAEAGGSGLGHAALGAAGLLTAAAIPAFWRRELTLPAHGNTRIEDGHLVVGNLRRDQRHHVVMKRSTECALAVQQAVLGCLTGRRISTASLRRQASCLGLDYAGGESQERIADLIADRGFAVETRFDCSIPELWEALSQGRKVLAPLDGEEIHAPQYGSGGQALEMPGYGHAVWVIGLRLSPTSTLSVVINDPRNRAGAGAIVDGNDFINAWTDFGRQATFIDPKRKAP